MPVTIKQIAELAGVSRGTVDRALNGRGGVRPEIEKRIKELADQLDYKPNVMAKSLANSRKKITIGVLVNSGGNPFFDKVIDGIEQAKNEIASFYVNVITSTLTGYDVGEQLAAIDALVEQGIGALVITAINDPAVCERLNAIASHGVEIITLNSDVSGLQKLCFVGCDYYKSGQTAGELIRLIVHDNANVGIITGSHRMLGHTQRIDGFKAVLSECGHGIEVRAIEECFDDDTRCYSVTKQVLAEHPDIGALYFCAGGVRGGIKAVSELHIRKLTIITVDDTDDVVEYVHQGLVTATICQQPFFQGYNSVKVAFDKLIEGKTPERKHIYTHNEVKTKYNI